MGQLWSGTRGPHSCVSPSVCVAQRCEQQRVTVLGRGEGAMATLSSVCVALAAEESSFSRAGEWQLPGLY